uniref:Triptychon and cpc n=1 Tax=Rhizophora mucronata TaxID=61149 RepID=A0A2P2J4Q0_RHIMU
MIHLTLITLGENTNTMKDTYKLTSLEWFKQPCHLFIYFFQFHSLVECLEFQYFSISSAVLPGILPAIKDHLSPTRLYILITRFSSSSENSSSNSPLVCFRESM